MTVGSELSRAVAAEALLAASRSGIQDPETLALLIKVFLKTLDPKPMS